MNEEEIYKAAKLLEDLGYSEEQLINDLVNISLKNELHKVIKGSKHD